MTLVIEFNDGTKDKENCDTYYVKDNLLVVEHYGYRAPSTNYVLTNIRKFYREA